jgi:hypothetical protein
LDRIRGVLYVRTGARSQARFDDFAPPITAIRRAAIAIGLPAFLVVPATILRADDKLIVDGKRCLTESTLISEEWRRLVNWHWPDI